MNRRNLTVKKLFMVLLCILLIAAVIFAEQQITSESASVAEVAASTQDDKAAAVPTEVPEQKEIEISEPKDSDSGSNPTEATEPIGTTEPTALPKDTPEPSGTPKPSETPKPTATPKPSATPRPASPSQESLPAEALAEIPQEYRQLAYYDQDKYERYQVYKANNPDFSYDKVILNVNIGLDNPFYSNIETIKDPGALNVLVNKYHKLPDNYAPELVEIPKELCAPGVAKQYLRKEAKEAFEKKHYDAKKLGLNITAYGTYRSIQTQHDIWNRKVNSGRSIEDVDKLNARGGHSEHNTGLAVDVIKNDYTMENTKEFAWFKDHAHEYGFIIRYPKEMEGITGYQYEPWHLRYLGVELATKVYNSGLTYEAYYAMEIEPYMN